jgi:hypothetical protein
VIAGLDPCDTSLRWSVLEEEIIHDLMRALESMQTDKTGDL